MAHDDAKRMSRDYLDIFEFGRQLIETQDLDPVYTVVYHAGLGDRVNRWLVPYWCFYHVGSASLLSEQPFSKLLSAASTKEYPRGTERRHFRGQQAVTAAGKLIDQYKSADALVHRLTRQVTTADCKYLPLSLMMERVKLLHGFGDWIAFKVADMLERLDLAKIEFKPQDVFHMFDSPRKGAERMAQWYDGPKTNPYMWAYETLIRKIGRLKAPPRFERTINIQECETILCKWHSHTNDHYTVGKDIQEVHEALVRFKDSPTAQQLLKAMKKAKLCVT